MKKYISGFALGIFVTVFSFNVMGAVQSYTLNKYTTPIYIQGVKYPTDALPVLTLNQNGGDNTYVPLRNFGEMIGADVDFNASAGRIDVTLNGSSTSNNSNTGTTTPVATPAPINTDRVSLNGLTREYNSTYKVNVYTYNGSTYVNTDEIDNYYLDDDYKYDNDDYDFEDDTYTRTNTITLEQYNKAILSDISAIRTNDDDDYLIKYDYFVNTIYPIIK